MNYDGFYLIDKEADWTSFDICARMRRTVNTRRVGHTGTLDPFATGLLIIAVGKCTKMIPFLEKAKKTYITKILLGKTSETLDTESEITDCTPPEKISSREEIEKIIAENFMGKIKQTPPQFSAIKINGKKACDLARSGQKVAIKERDAEVFSIEILSYDFPEIEIELTTAAGFYVRSFASSLGKLVANGGMCLELRRTKINDIAVIDAINVTEISTPIDPKHILTHLKTGEISPGRIPDFVSGRSFDYPGIEGEKILVTVTEKSIGIGEILHGKLQPRIVL